MNITPDDPKWTAYVLGELNEAERAQVEQELESSALAREVVEEIRLATSMLKREFAKEQMMGLAAAQRGVIRAKAEPTHVRPIFRWAAVAGSVAAGLFVVASLSIPSLLRSRQAAVETTAALVPPVDGTRTTPSESDRDLKKQRTVYNRQKLEAEIQQAQRRQLFRLPPDGTATTTER